MDETRSGQRQLKVARSRARVCGCEMPSFGIGAAERASFNNQGLARGSRGWLAGASPHSSGDAGPVSGWAIGGVYPRKWDWVWGNCL